jgi:hypothetical protein
VPKAVVDLSLSANGMIAYFNWYNSFIPQISVLQALK